jgi:hypothetical protein
MNRTFKPAPRLRRAVFQIGGETLIVGIEFTGNNGLYFWVPDVDHLYKWVGYTGWVGIDPGQLGAKRRTELLKVWGETPVTVCP